MEKLSLIFRVDRKIFAFMENLPGRNCRKKSKRLQEIDSNSDEEFWSNYSRYASSRKGENDDYDDDATKTKGWTSDCHKNGETIEVKSDVGIYRVWKPLKDLRGYQGALLIIFIILSGFCSISEECPLACECKWKSGKESVICANPKGNNKLSSIPAGLEPGTQVLDLSGNNIPILPANVFHNMNLLNLQKIFLSNCALKTLDKDVFFKLNNLVQLDLSVNRPEFAPTHTFDQIPELRELKFNSNPIGRISNDAFAPLSHLVRLELTGCKLGTIEPFAFRGLTSLEWLRLDNNRLYSVQAISLYPLKSLHGLEMHGNPWNCSCTLQPLRDWMTKNNVPFGIPPVCSEPSRLAGKSWDQLQLEEFACLPKVQTSSIGSAKVSKVNEGENATLLCRLQATSDTQVRWMNGNKPVVVATSGNSNYLLTESFAWEPGESTDGASNGQTLAKSSSKGKTLGTKTSKLTVIRTKLRDSGTYSCRAESRAGSVSANFTLLVLQNKAEQLTGRFLLYGAAVAALLTLSICVLLLCVIFTCGRRSFTNTRILTEDKLELNHIGQNHRGQNGGTVPLIANHHNSNNTTSTRNNIHNNHHQPTVHNKSAITANNVAHRPSNHVTNYKSLPTAEPESEMENNGSEPEDDLDVVIVDNKSRQSGPMSPKVHSASSSFKESRPAPAVRPRGLDPKTKANNSSPHNSSQVGTPNKRSEEHQQKYPDLIDEQMPFVVQSPPDFSSLPRTGQSVRDQQEMAILNHQNDIRHQSKPRPMMGSSGRGGYLQHHRRVNSESQSPLLLHQQQATTMNSSGYSVLSSSSNDSPYGSTCTYQTQLTGSNRTLTSSGSKLSQNNPKYQPFGKYNYHSGSTFHNQQMQYHPILQRRSMPTSPVHEPRSLYDDSLYSSYGASAIPRHQSNSHEGSLASQSIMSSNKMRAGSDPVAPTECEYDYHAAQLAAFLEEYRVLQMELMRMSASLQQVTDANPKGTSGSGTANNGPTNTNLTNSNNSTSFTSSNVNNLPSSLSMQTQSVQNSNPSLVNNSLQQQNLKSILKNCSGNNNNYVT